MFKQALSIFIILLLSLSNADAQIGIGTASPNASAMLDISSANKGVLFPRMNAVARLGIATPATGLVVFDTDSSSLFIFNSNSWKKIMPVNSLNSLVTGTSSGDVLVWNGTIWVPTPVCNLFTYLYRDKDGDGKGDKYSPVTSCGPFPGFVADSTDCDDNNASITTYTWYRDADGDGFGNINLTTTGCTPPAGFIANNTDCDDGNASINPNGTDLPDDGFADTNCDGIDGKETDAIFVSVSTGNDVNAGTRLLPVKTITTGINKAVTNGKSQVLVSLGTYNETVTMQAGVSIYGGYSAASNWTRSAANTTTINGQAGTIYAGVIATGISTATTIDRFVIKSANAAGTTTISTTIFGNSSYGVYTAGCSNLIIKNNTILPGNGATSTAAATGNTGSTGGNGGGGIQGQCDGSISATGGNGGTSPCSAQAGGKGGNGGFSNTLPATAGTNGVGGATGGFAGNFGNPGSPGSGGTNGTNGSAGSGSSGATISTGGMISVYWAGQNGTTGGTAGPGNGGGGGGGGGGQFCTFCTDGTGNGGGGGGGGGCGGEGGSGGIPGGGSFGIFFVNTGTGNQCINNNITSGHGGNGGQGGTGGAGGTGGTGASAATNCTAEVGASGKGGNGGTGGQGGGAGGGAGGASYGIFTNIGASITTTANSVTVGLAGVGGTGGTGGNTGGIGVNGATGTIGTP